MTAQKKKAPAKKKPSPKKNGRPKGSSRYSKDWTPIAAEGMAREGMLEKEIAVRMGIAESTLNKWKQEYPELKRALRKGRETPNARTVGAMYKRSWGYEVEESSSRYDAKGKLIGTTVTMRHIPPDTGAGVFILINRDPDNWKDRKVLAPTIQSDTGKELAEAVRNI